MKSELVSEFGVSENNASVIPFGVNNTVPNTGLTTAEARQQLGLGERDKTMLFFGNIAPYKGIEFLVAAFIEVAKKNSSYRLIVAGRPKGSEDYWKQLQETIARSGVQDRVVQKIEYIHDAQTEAYFKAADVLVLPYVHVFQSGVLFLGYNFGLPVIAADVGSLKEEIVEGKTGFVFEAGNAVALALAIENYFAGNLYCELSLRRREIQDFANDRYSWSKVTAITTAVYSKLLRPEDNHCPHCAAEKP